MGAARVGRNVGGTTGSYAWQQTRAGLTRVTNSAAGAFQAIDGTGAVVGWGRRTPDTNTDPLANAREQRPAWQWGQA